MTTIAFTKVKLPHGWLGNMAPYPVTFAGKTWRTTEALFQALRFNNEDVRTLIHAEKSPMAAKMVAKKHSELMVVVPASKQDLQNMEMVCRLKLEQHPEHKKLLKATGDALIVEDITKRAKGGRHSFWGAALVQDKWEGDNALGKIWMKLRSEVTIQPQ